MMSTRYPLDPFALPVRPEIQLPLLIRGRADRLHNGVRALRAAGLFFLVSFVLASALFVPVFLVEADRVDAIVVDGRTMGINQFASHAEGLFFGTLVLAVAIVSFFASAVLARGSCRGAGVDGFAKTDLPDAPLSGLLEWGGFVETDRV